MGKALIIAEKPSVASDISKALGKFQRHEDYFENDDYLVSSAVGHLLTIVPPPGVEATNDFGRPGWAGPCPPSGTHNYEFVLYALAEPSGVTAGQPATDAIAAIEGRAMYGSAALSGQASAG